MPGLTILHGCRTIQLTKGKNTLIDEADWPLVGHFTWHASRRRQRVPVWCADRNIRVAGCGTTIGLHRCLCDAGQVDHINGDSLDNRRENLRPCTHAENQRNMRATWGVSRYKGVTRTSVTDSWRSQISDPSGKRTHLGCFRTEEEAARAYDIAARSYFGDFAKTNAEIFGDF